MKQLFTFIFLLTSISISFAAKPSHSEWDELLKKHVNGSGKVNYTNFKKDVAKLDAYIKILKDNAPESDWSANEKKAFWINCYNAHAIKLVISKNVTKSINDLKVDGKGAFDYDFIEVGGTKMSLNDLETNKLRKAFKDGRIHFAVNCASISCPTLYNKAFTADNVESNLSMLAKKFISDKSRNKISADKAELSKIFDWYKEDFGNVVDFINKYSSLKMKAETKITYLEYDWNLNKQ